MNKNLKSKNDGFTIIEVLIVLAIAALIMLIVFIAVPALQRNAANNDIRQQASRLATAATEFRTNANDTVPAASVSTTANSNAATLKSMASAGGTTTISATAPSTAVLNALTKGNFIVTPGATCNGLAPTLPPPPLPVPLPRSVTVSFGLAGGGYGCIQS